MDENKTTEQTTPVSEMSNDALKEAIETQLRKVRMAALLSGSKAICGVVLQYINEFQQLPGKKSANDYKRLIKKINEFCSKSLGRTIDENGNVVPVKKEQEESSDQE